MDNKVCNKCNKELTLDKFGKCKNTKDGLKSQCKECRNEKKRKYTKENHVKISEYNKKNREDNREKFIEKERKYREEHSDKQKIASKKYYEANVEKCRECNREHYKRNKVEISEWHKEYRKANLQEHQEREKKYRIENSDKCKESKKKYILKNKTKITEYRRKYSIKNKLRISQYHKKYCEENKEKEMERHRIYSKNNREKIIMNTQRRRSRIRGLECSLTIEQWETIKAYFNNRCAYCNKELPLEKEHFIATINMGELSQNNIICACRSCNASKGYKSFFTWYPKHKSYSKKREKLILKFLNYENGQQQLKII